MADERDCAVVGVYVDKASHTSGCDDSRPAFSRLLADVRAGLADSIVTYSYGRLVRNLDDFERLLAVYLRTKVGVVTVMPGTVDLSSAEGRLVARGEAIVSAEGQEDRRSERLDEARREALRSGRYFGPRPFGYDFAVDARDHTLMGTERSLVINRAEAAAIRDAVQRVVSGEPLWSIAKHLNGVGVTTSRGSPWRTQSLRRMLLRWVHVGYRTPTTHQERLDPHRGAWEPIIDLTTHELVTEMLTDPVTPPPSSSASEHLLAGIAVCGRCGNRAVVTNSYTYTVKGSYIRKDGTRSPARARTFPARYKCSQSGCRGVARNAELVDQLVGAAVVEYLTHHGARLFEKQQRLAETTQAELVAIHEQRTSLEQRRRLGLVSQWESEAAFAKMSSSTEWLIMLHQMALPLKGLDNFNGAGAAEAWQGADIATRKRVLRALTELVSFEVTLDPITSSHLSPEERKRQGVRVEMSSTTRTSHEPQ